ncbi:DUF1249 domain-containing protein [Imhoffiella purpurea]|uniref:DUF1249 domain-containing protein n=1 Tax=Imhoffiella purpurea TaxID=1249627 RepID=UPI001E4CB01D|nr:DUF1249 domain-containing protein [Imhoffiella purpurea]
MLSRLAPNLCRESGVLVSRQSGTMDLHLHILEQSPYTTEIRLTYLFDAQASSTGAADPDAHLRVYHDARQVELLDLQQAVLPLRVRYAPPALADKWQANLFLSKWLDFCLKAGHGFGRIHGFASASGEDLCGEICLARS